MPALTAPDNALAPSQQALRLSDAEEERIVQYARARLGVELARWVALPALLVWLTLSGQAARLLATTAVPGLAGWQAHALYLLTLGVLVRLSLLPLAWLGDFWIDKRFGLLRQRLPAWGWEWLCRSAVLGGAAWVALLPLVETLRWWPWLALPWCAAWLWGRALFDHFVYSPLMRCFYPIRFLRNETFMLPGVGRRTLPVFEMRVSHVTASVNAMIWIPPGRQAAIVVTDTLLDAFTDGEERVVMAHEFGHFYDVLHLEQRTGAGVAQAKRKALWGLAQLLAGVVALLAMHLLAPRLGLGGVEDLSGFPLLAALALILTRVLTPFLYAEARQDERDADRYALAITGDPENYLSVMRKLRAINLEMSEPGPLGGLWPVSHPPFSERALLADAHRRRPVRKPRWRGFRRSQRPDRRY